MVTHTALRAMSLDLLLRPGQDGARGRHAAPSDAVLVRLLAAVSGEGRDTLMKPACRLSRMNAHSGDCSMIHFSGVKSIDSATVWPSSNIAMNFCKAKLSKSMSSGPFF